jgi:uncharacterized protein with PIN domain
MRFICDDNLGKLARYLRFLGFDTFFAEPISDCDLMRLASSQKRFLLTRDSHLTSKSHPFGILLIRQDDPLTQLKFTISSLNPIINPATLFSRCSRCNEVCDMISGEEAEGKTFPFVLKTQKLISKCPSCGRLYWKGTHYQKLLKKLRVVIPTGNTTGQWPD